MAMVEGGMKCVKYLLFAFNLIFLVSPVLISFFFLILLFLWEASIFSCSSLNIQFHSDIIVVQLSYTVYIWIVLMSKAKSHQFRGWLVKMFMLFLPIPEPKFSQGLGPMLHKQCALGPCFHEKWKHFLPDLLFTDLKINGKSFSKKHGKFKLEGVFLKL